MRPRISAAVFCLVVLVCSPGLAARGIKLRYERPKKVRAFQIAIRTTIRQEVAGCTIERAEWLTLNGSFQPAEGNGAHWQVRVELTGLKGGATTPFEELSFDTNDGKNSAAAFLRRYDYAGSHLVLEMSPVGPDRSSAPAFIRPKTNNSNARIRINPGDVLSLLSGLGSDPIQDMFLTQAVLGVLPEYPRASVKPGEVWTTKAYLSNGGIPLAGSIAWRPDAVNHTQCRLTAEGIMAINFTRETNAFGRRLTRQVEASGDLRGEAEVMRRNGWPVHGIYRIGLLGRVAGSGMETPLSIQMEIEYSFDE